MTCTVHMQVNILHRFEEVRGLEVVVWETVEQPSTVSVVILSTPGGWDDIASVDKSDAGAVARMISLAEIVHDTLQSAEMAWIT